MKRAMERGAILLGLILAGGCQGTRYPSCRTARLDAEARSYKWHDPFPDETIGPKTGCRPRDFDTPRSYTRKTYDWIRKIPDDPGVPPSQSFWNPGGLGATTSVLPPKRPPPLPVASDASRWDDSLPRYNVVPQ